MQLQEDKASGFFEETEVLYLGEERADLVVLSQNLLTIEPNEIMNTTVSKTMSNGVWVYTK